MAHASSQAQNGIMDTNTKQRWPLFYALLYAHKHGLLLCFATCFFDRAGYRAGTGVEEKEHWNDGLGRTRPGHSSQNEHRVNRAIFIFPAPFKMKPIANQIPMLTFKQEGAPSFIFTPFGWWFGRKVRVRQPTVDSCFYFLSNKKPRNISNCNNAHCAH